MKKWHTHVLTHVYTPVHMQCIGSPVSEREVGMIIRFCICIHYLFCIIHTSIVILIEKPVKKK